MNKQSCQPDFLELSNVEVVSVQTEGGIGDFRQAREQADSEAEKRFAEFILISWYDRERNYEAPAHVSECGDCGLKSGYIHYALSRGTRLKVEVDSGRFVFFYTPVEW